MKSALVSVTALSVLLSACTANPLTGEPQMSKGLLGAGTGAAVGAAAGALLGSTTSLNTRKAALVGAGIGALAGGSAGLYMDSQEAKLRQRLENSGVSVTRDGDRIILNMPSNITFDSDRADIMPAFFDTLNSVAIVLKEYNQTLVDVVGHTDSDGTDAHNLDLSRRRAQAVASYLTAQQIDSKRFEILGRGETNPIAPNTTAEGKASNRRVEITITPLT